MAQVKARRSRLLVLAVIAVVSAAAFAGAYVVRQGVLDRRALASGEAGRKALADGDYPGALDGLGRFMQRFGDSGATAEDHVLYARARRNVPLPNRRHLPEAIKILRHTIGRFPDCAEAKTELLDLYVESGYATEALELLESMLSAAPRDLALLRRKRDVLVGLRRFTEALKVASAVDELAPDDVEGFLVTLRIRAETQTTVGETDAWVDKLIAARAGDPRFELIRVAHLLRKRDPDVVERVNEILDRLTALPTAAEPAFAKLLVGQLDAAARFDDSLRVLEKVEAAADREIRIDHVRRLWFARRADKIPELVERWKDDAVAADPEVAALTTLALIVVNRDGDAAQARGRLAASQDAVGKAWSAFVDAAARKAPADRGVVAALAEATTAVPDSPILHQALGDAHSALGELDLAVRDWETAAKLTLIWSRPLHSIARANLATPGRARFAEEPARAAFRRSPRDVEVIRTAIEAITSGGGEPDSKFVDQMLATLDFIRRAAPDHSTGSLPLEVQLLLGRDRARAEELVRSALAPTAKCSESTLLRLAQFAAMAGFPLEMELLAHSESRHGATPQLALSKAIAVARRSDAAAGLAAFDELRSRDPASASSIDWGLARASLVSAAGGPDAGTAWTALADAHPKELRVQLGALGASAVWANREATARVIERVRELTGDEGTTWRIAHARWVLADGAATDTDVAQAAAQLDGVTRIAPNNATAHQLLARALERLGNDATAESELRHADAILPGSTWITLELARLAQKQGRSDEARSLVAKAVAAKDLSPEQAESAAYLLAVQGDARGGADLLAPLTSSSAPSRSGLLLLAQLYARLGETERALGLCERLLSRPDADLVQFTADLLVSLGRPADADSVLLRLDASNSRPGDRELVRARNLLRRGSPEAARDAYRAAAKAAPDRADVWTEYLSRAVGAGDVREVNSILDDAQAAGVEAVQFAKSERALYASTIGDPRLRESLIVMLEDKSARPALKDALKTVAAAAADPSKQRETARAVRVLAEANVSVLALQLLAARLCAASGDVKRAGEIARKAMTRFPNSVPAARLTAELYVQGGRRSEALDAALVWKDRAAAVDLESELFVAGIQLQAGRAEDAASRLAPRVPGALARPSENQKLILVHAMALVRSGRELEATRLLGDLASRSPEWRTLPLALGPEWMGDAAGAKAWLQACAVHVPPDDASGRLLLSRGWAAAWQVYRDPALLAAAQAGFGALVASPDCSAQALFSAAILAKQTGDVATARSRYEAAIKRDPGLSDARNNLATILADSGEWEAAVVEATAAMKTRPGNANYLDTLAYALRKGGKFDQAKARLEAAIQLEPANPAWQLSLAELLLESSDRAGAAQAVSVVEEIQAGGFELSEGDRDRLARVRSGVR